MENSFTAQDGRYQHIEVRREKDDITFVGDRSGSDCYHTLKPKNFAAFVVSVGQPAGADIMTAIGEVLKTEPSRLWTAVHSGLTTTDFSWMSMSDIESITD